jgi:hypothetical protein
VKQLVPLQAKPLHDTAVEAEQVGVGLQVGAGVRTPAVQLSVPQVEPLERKLSPGQLSLVPVQVSGRSQAPAVPRQTTVLAAYLAAQPLLVPSQVSATSQTCALAGLQTKPDDCFASAGQVALVPLQVSVMSHGPWEALHTWPEGDLTSPGQMALLPLHTSAGSQAPNEGLQTKPLPSSRGTPRRCHSRPPQPGRCCRSGRHRQGTWCCCPYSSRRHRTDRQRNGTPRCSRSADRCQP